ncbi:pantetheine-phosphate adenylyltransferase [Anaerolineales bacterium HSG25]|nr:pantetheine-phosphate adenylyltransferase [Anaerolineales bacterium HSG25]
MMRAVYPATFDPITNGHIDIAERASKVFDELIVAVFDLPAKNLLFSAEKRLAMTTEAVSHLDNVIVMEYSGLTVDFAKKQNALVMVRGLRVMSDFEWELQLSLTNHSLDPNIETVCLMASQEYSFLSSSILKDIAFNRGNITHLAPPIVIEALQAHIRS